MSRCPVEFMNEPPPSVVSIGLPACRLVRGHLTPWPALCPPANAAGCEAPFVLFGEPEELCHLGNERRVRDLQHGDRYRVNCLPWCPAAEIVDIRCRRSGVRVIITLDRNGDPAEAWLPGGQWVQTLTERE